MEIRKMKLSELTPAEYNPRVELKPGDQEWEALDESIDSFGYVEPIVWNERTGNIVGGHQRRNVLLARGVEEEDISVVNLSPEDEKILNVLLNKSKGIWDVAKLVALIDEIKAAGGNLKTTGFTGRFSGRPAMNKLTPVQSVGGLLFKRDDLYEPFGPGEVNGGKMRQCMMLLDSVKDEITGVISCCSIHSPQAPITAAAALAFGKQCKILYGGTSRAKLLESPMPRLCLKYGATVLLATRSGRHNVLYAKAKELKGPEDFIVQYGINLSGHSDVLLGAVAAQVENIPDEIENLVMTCGSGITASGVMIGLNRYGKKVRNVHLVATAPDRRESIHRTLREHGADRDFIYHDLFHTEGFAYEKPATAVWGGITLHPNYEAKTMQWFVKSGLDPGSTLFWIVGAAPRNIPAAGRP